MHARSSLHLVLLEGRNKEQDNFSSTISLYPPAESLALFAHSNSASSLGASFFLARQRPGATVFTHFSWPMAGSLSKQEKKWFQMWPGAGPSSALADKGGKSHFLGEGSKREEVTGSVDHRLLTTF